MGDGFDFEIYHNGTDNIIDCKNDRNLKIVNDASGGNEIMALFDPNGAVQLYHNNTLRLETRTNDVKFHGGLVGIDNAQIQVGNSADLKIYHDGTDSYVDNLVTGNLRIRGNSAGAVELHPKGGQYGLRTIPDGSTELYHSGSLKFGTRSSGVDIFGLAEVYGTVRPNANNSHDLGTSSLRWANVYTNDLNLSNEGGANDVDGTWGSYTIQEGAEDLFLINKRNGKKYKFALMEVS